MKQTLKLLGITLFALGIFVLVKAPSAHAATLSVASGSDETTTNGSCSLSEAITNINNGNSTSYPDCVDSEPFGSSDTIRLPSGLITLTANLPTIVNSTIIQGDGMGASVISGSLGQYAGLNFSGATGTESFSIRQLTVTAFYTAGIYSNNGNVSLEQVEVDGADAYNDGSFMAGVALGSGASDVQFTLSDVYVHDLEVGTVNTMFGVATIVSGAGNAETRVNRVTVSNLHAANTPVSAMVFSVGVFGADPANGDMNAQATNVTVSNVSSDQNTAAGIVSITFGTDQQTNVQVRNTTVTGLRGIDTSSIGMSTGGIAAATVAADPNLQTQARVSVKNSIIQAGCAMSDLGSVVIGPSAGAGLQSITSEGGNLSDDSTCTSYLTQPTDKTNVGNLESTLGTLSNNGGYIPTIPLLAGSPAIDAGVAVAGLTADARLVLRPQGSAFDSGAYEYTAPAKAPGQLASTGQDQEYMYALAILMGLSAVVYIAKEKLFQ
jgi:hypothetical protein